MKILLISLSVFLMIGCVPKNPSHSKLNNTIYDGNHITKNIHEQGYFNCINSGASKGYCSKRHNFRPSSGAVVYGR